MSMALYMAEQARARLEPEESLAGLFEAYARHGLLHVDSGLVLLAHECTFDPVTREVSHGPERNAWFVRLAARAGIRGRGTGGGAQMLADFLRIVPTVHEWALWCRRGEQRVRAYRMRDLQLRVARN
jgi:hypothetical protein